MVERREERRLAAILAADMVSYSRLVEADERGTIARQKAHRKELIDPEIAAHSGRIVKTTGDGMLAEFASVVDATECAVAIQRAMVEREAEVSEERRIRYRVGINLGDIIIEDEDILGDGVNVAARLEGLAEPGGVCVSGTVMEHVAGKLDLGFEDLGEQQVKNIEKPVHVYRVLLKPEADDTGIPEELMKPNAWRLGAIATAAVAVIVVAAMAVWWQPWAPNVEPASVERVAFPLPDRPSIAVLAFQNMSDDASQEYFADGIAEDIITDLSKLSGLFVIARNSSFKYKGQAVDVQQVGHEMGVKYLLEGSVRRAGDQVRITAQLIDVETGGHLWADRYDGGLDDVFALQDQVTGHIIDALRVQLTPSQRLAVDASGTDKPAAYDAYLRGLRLLADRRRIDVENNRAAQAEFEEAIRIDPDYALAIAGLAWAKWLHVESINAYDSPAPAFALAEKSLALSDNALAHRTLSKRHLSLQSEFVLTTKNADLAVAALEKARQLQPNDPDILTDLATALSFAGRPDEALTLIQEAMELNPNHPDWYYGALGIALLLTGDSARAVRHLRTWSEAHPSWRVPLIFLAAALANTGKVAAAKLAVARFGALYGIGTKTTLVGVQRMWPMAKPQQDLFLKGLRLAGVKETAN